LKELLERVCFPFFWEAKVFVEVNFVLGFFIEWAFLWLAGMHIGNVGIQDGCLCDTSNGVLACC
jgi:hypothetical protein